MGDAAEHQPAELPPQVRFAPDRMGVTVGVREEVEPPLGQEFEISPEPPLPTKLVLLKGGIEQRGGAVVPKIPKGARSVPLAQASTAPPESTSEDILEEVSKDLLDTPSYQLFELQAENHALGRLVAKLYAENEALRKLKP